MNSTRRALLALLLTVVSIGTAFHAHAQSWPGRAVTLIAPSSPGSTPDVIARLLAERLSHSLGQQVVVVNRAGAGGNVGSELVAKAAPDGHTLLLGSIANTINPHLIKGAPFALEDLAPISSVAAAPDILAVHPSVPVHTFAELAAWLKANPGTDIAMAGSGTTPHLSAEMLRSMLDVRLTMVPYQGGGAVIQALVAKQVPLAFATSVGIIPRLKSGQLRAIGIASGRRIEAMPDLPTLAEAGLKDFEITAWFGLFAPAGTPRAIVDRLATETRNALAQPELRKRLIDLGAEPLGSSPDQFAAFVQAELKKWGALIRSAGIKSE